MGMGKIDRPFLIALLILAGIGTLMVYSASMYSLTISESSFMQVFKQFFYAAFGIVCMLGMSHLDYRKLNNKRFVQGFFAITVILLAAVYFTPLGLEVNGGKRWLDLQVTTLQPSELAKFSGILYIIELMVRKPEILRKHTQFFKEVVLPSALLLGLILIEPSLSATLAVGVGLFSALFFSGIRFKLILPYLLLCIPGVIALMVATPWRLARLTAFFTGSPEYQVKQSLLAIGSGGIFGTGLGNGKQKLLFLPEMQNDFIFANIGEETGFLGILLVFGMFSIFAYFGYKASEQIKNKDPFFSYICFGFTTMIIYQALANIAVVIGVLPPTGIVLPFFSQGGTNLFVVIVESVFIYRVIRMSDHEKKYNDLQVFDYRGVDADSSFQKENV